MRKLLTLLIVFSSLQLVSQTSAPAAKKPAPKKPSAATVLPPTAVIDTTAGKLTCVLFPDKAPIGVANFIGLARGTKDWTNPATGRKMHGVPLYNGTIFHRVIPGFMIQGGDPLGTGEGDPGYKFKNETSPDLKFDRPGRLAYANAGPDTNGSQFFITEDVQHSSHLTGSYTIFGQCDDASVALVQKIARVPTDERNNKPLEAIKINHITITGMPGAAAAKKPAALTAKSKSKTGTAKKKTATKSGEAPK